MEGDLNTCVSGGTVVTVGRITMPILMRREMMRRRKTKTEEEVACRVVVNVLMVEV